jgi:hypothetical protein
MFLMDEGTNEILNKVRSRIEADLEDDSETMDESGEEGEGEYQIGERTLEALEGIRQRLEGDLSDDGEDELGEGTGQAKNRSDVGNTLDLYLDMIFDHLVSELGLDEEAAQALIFRVADEKAASGDLPLMPTEKSSDDDIAVWLGKAKTLGFEHEVLKATA